MKFEDGEGLPKAGPGGRGRLRGAGNRRNDGGIDGRRRLTGQSPTATAGPIDKGCTADMRTPARHGAGARGALLPRGVRGRVDREIKRTVGGPGAQLRSRGSTGPARKGAGWHAPLPPRQARHDAAASQVQGAWGGSAKRPALEMGEISGHWPGAERDPPRPHRGGSEAVAW